jgi:ribosomal protein S18 acetylase RimI-like enzyme
VRRRLPQGGLGDVLGELVSWRDGELVVRRADGELVQIEEDDVVAGRTVPPAPPPRRPGVPHVSPEEMQRIANAGWPARETEPLGEWLLRAHDGQTGRANSVMAVGDPGRPLDAALDRVVGWYGERGLPPLLQLPEQAPLNVALEERGWGKDHVTIVQAAAIPTTLDLLPARPDLAGAVRAEPDERWLDLMHDLDRRDPAGHVAILTGPARVGFATVTAGGEPAGIGRVSIEGEWAGVTSVDVAPDRRRQGIGSAVMRTLLEWAQAQGARAAYLQVRALNEPALALYQRLGFLTHHPYCYRSLRP